MSGFTPILTVNITVDEFDELCGDRTHADIAKEIGVSKATVGRWRVGLGIPNPQQTDRLERWIYRQHRRMEREQLLRSPLPVEHHTPDECCSGYM